MKSGCLYNGKHLTQQHMCAFSDLSYLEGDGISPSSLIFGVIFVHSDSVDKTAPSILI